MATEDFRRLLPKSIAPGTSFNTGTSFDLFSPTPIVGAGPITPPSEEEGDPFGTDVTRIGDLEDPNTLPGSSTGIVGSTAPPVLVGSGGTLPFTLTEPIGTNIQPGLKPPPGAKAPKGAPPPVVPQPSSPAPTPTDAPRDLSTGQPPPSLLSRLERVQRRSLLGRP